MLDQNTAIILSTLLGGVLTIIGGLIATYYADRRNRYEVKRQEFRLAIDNMLDLTGQIYSLYIEIFNGLIYKSPELSDKNLIGYLGGTIAVSKLNILVNAYFPQLQNDIKRYAETILSMENTFYKIDASASDEYKDQLYLNIMQIFQSANREFHLALIRVVRQKGFSFQ